MITRRKILGGLLACAYCPPLTHAEPPSVVEDPSFKILCSMRKTPSIKSISNVRPAPSEAVRIIHWISELIGVRPEFEVLAADFKHRNIAIAATRGDQRYVVYDGKWFPFQGNQVSWYSVYVFGHEIGHHIHGHTLGLLHNRHQAELDADRFGGWVVGRLGGRLDHALTMMSSLSEKGSKTHPPRNQRIEATRDGWLAGSSTLR